MAGDLGTAALPVDGVQHQVEQRRELERLPVAAADQGWWGPVAGPHHRPDELEVVDARGRVDERGHCGGVSVLGSVAPSADVGASPPAEAVGVAVAGAGSSVDAVSVSGGSTEPWSMSEIWSDVASATPGDGLGDDGVLCAIAVA